MANAPSKQEVRQDGPYGARGPSSSSVALESWAQTFFTMVNRYFYGELVPSFSSATLQREAELSAAFRQFLGRVRDVAAEMERHLDAGLPPPLDGPAVHVLAARSASALGQRLEADRPTLTPTQILVMQLLNDGLSGGQVAERLIVSEKTIRTHVRRVIERLQALGFTVRGMRDALAILRSFHLVDDRSPQ